MFDRLDNIYAAHEGPVTLKKDSGIFVLFRAANRGPRISAVPNALLSGASLLSSSVALRSHHQNPSDPLAQ